jgi:glycosyltransferase involved in cell wall biosynthesis
MPFAEICELYARAGASIDADVTTVVLGNPAAEPLPSVHYLGASDLKQTRALARRLDSQASADWDLVLCHRYRAYLTAVLSRVDNRRCVAVAHEFGLMRRWGRRLHRHLYGRGVAFAGVSPAVRDELAALVGHAVLLPNGIDLAEFDEHLLTRETARAKLGLPLDPLCIGVVGRLHYKKRPELALAAFREFVAAPSPVLGDCESSGALLAFVGPGEIDVQDETVRLLGEIADARYCLSAFDILLIASSDAEAFGMVALEGMAAGVPVVTSRSPGPQYVLGSLGFYADADDARGFAQAMEEARACDVKALREASRSRVTQEFSVQATARRLDALLVERGTTAHKHVPA